MCTFSNSISQDLGVWVFEYLKVAKEPDKDKWSTGLCHALLCKLTMARFDREAMAESRMQLAAAAEADKAQRKAQEEAEMLAQGIAADRAEKARQRKQESACCIVM